VAIDVPFQPVTVAACQELAERLDEAQRIFGSRGIAVPAGNRLQLAARLLRQIHEANSFPVDRGSLLTVGNAIRLAFNATQIANALRPGIPEGLRDMVPRFFGGGLADVGPSAAHQAQTQLVIGAICAAGGLNPKVPRPQAGKTPDFVVQARGLDICMEVKRLGSEARVEDSIYKALKQCTEFGSAYNAVMLDVSDILVPNALDAVVDEQQMAELVGRFAPIRQAASNLITRRSAEDPYCTTLFLGVTADAFVWRSNGRGGVTPAARVFAYHEVFQGAVAGLVVTQSLDLRERIVRGMNELGASIREFRAT
jgi:hypothetical protein